LLAIAECLQTAMELGFNWPAVYFNHIACKSLLKIKKKKKKGKKQ